MSYCRICEDSDVYVIRSDCYSVTVIGGGYFVRDTPQEILTLLDDISKLGYKVPQRAINRLKEETK